jgi:hypothetical protein
MSWVKRNLFFLIGSVVAFVLLGLAGFYLYSKWDLNNKVLDQLNQSYEDLKKLNAKNPHPGSSNINNTDAARDQIKEIKVALDKTRAGFEKIPRIPDLPKITDFEFSTALAQTIAQLARDATNSSVAIPTNYAFSFQAQRNRMNFAPTSLVPLSVQLGEIKTLCGVLFAAKVNSLEAIRRERVSPDDMTGSQSDYLSEKSITNALAVLTPYELVFHCFSPELAGVLSGLASSPHGFIVQSINVEAAPAVAMVEPTAVPVAPVYIPTPTVPAATQMTEEQRFRNRYNLGPGGESRGKFPMPQPIPQPYQPVVAAPQPKTLQTVIDEKQLRVTVLVQVVKLVSSPAPAAPARPPSPRQG